MKNTKIDWCDSTLNPVIGCKHGCPYCYAKKMNDRFHFIKQWDKPQFFPERLKELDAKIPKSIFMDSMSDIAFWEFKWWGATFAAMEKNKQHNYIFLTKSKIRVPKFGLENLYIGYSATHQSEIRKDDYGYDFISIEPILEPIDISNCTCIKQIIIGAETGNRKEKVIPQKEWISNIVTQADAKRIPVFMKESLRKIMGDDFRQDPLIWAINKKQ